jgi:diguanylate cyclase (GGDEF)-like protein
VSITLITGFAVVLAAAVFAALSLRRSLRAGRALHASDGRDRLTGLAERPALMAALERLRSGDGRFTVILIEFDRFHEINDVYGVEVGDQVIASVSTQLQAGVNHDEQLFRFSGPQFVLLCPAIAAGPAARERAAALQSTIGVRYRVHHDQLRISASVAIVVADPHQPSAEAITRDALAALDAAHRGGPGSIVVHEPAMTNRVAPVHGERRLREALERDEFELHYTPVVHIDDHTIAGVEALLRWADPARGLVMPGEFFETLEQSDLLGPATEWVIRGACRDNRSWAERFPHHDLVTTINISPVQLALSKFASRFLTIVAEEGIDPRRLCIEITEGAYTEHAEAMWTALRILKDAGVQLALDDFGTGTSTFTFLRRFDLDVLKIDRVFVQQVTDSVEDFSIVQQLCGMAHALDLVAIAEGVDTPEQLEVLTSAGCDLAQGYLFTRPLGPDAIEAFLAKGVAHPGRTRLGGAGRSTATTR